jgi:hypothetical protein
MGEILGRLVVRAIETGHDCATRLIPPAIDPPATPQLN